MAERSVTVRLAASVGAYVSSMGQAKKATDDVATAADKAGQKQGQSAKQAASAAAATAAALGREAQAAQDAAKAHDMHYNSAGKLVDANNKFVSSAAAAEAGLDQYAQAVVDSAKASEQAGEAAARAGGPLKRLGADLNDVAKSAKENRAAWDQAGTALTGFGAVAVGALGFAAKAAMDWESAWAGVTKTVDGTPEQMNELEGSLRGLAKTLPLTHTEIAGVAEAAGQLGVAREDVVGFTKTMIDLGESTNLTADDAATGIAQISNVMGTLNREGAEGVARFGSTLVELGNNGASTEADILSMAQRIAGAMATVGGSEVEVLALSNALASMGIKAELGGGVATRVLLGMYSSIKDGGPKLEAFAKTAGTSAAEFAAAFERSPVQALSMVAQGLGRVKDEGGNVVASLADMGIKGTESTQVMLALANSGTLLADGLAQGNAAWSENTALLEEANKRYATTESQVKIAWNGIKDAAIDAGAVVLPVIQQVAESVVDLAEVWGNLPAPVQGAIASLTGVVGVAALVAGGLLLIVPRALDTVNAFKTLKGDMPGLSSGLGAAAKSAGVLAAAFVGFEVIKGIHNSMQPATKSVEEFTQALIGMNENAGSIDDVFAKLEFGEGDRLAGEIDGIGEALDSLTNKNLSDHLASWGATSLGVRNSTADIIDAVDKMDQSLSSAVSSGNPELAAKGFKQIAESASESGVSIEEVSARFPAYMDALRGAASAVGVAVSDQELLNWALGETPPAMEAAAAGAEGTADALGVAGAAAEEAAAASEEMIDALAEIGLSAEGTIVDLQKFTDMLFSMGLATMSSRDAAFGWEETLRGMAGAVQEVVNSQGELGPLLNATGTDFNMMTDSGKAANEMLQGIVSDGLKVAETFSGDMSKSAAEVSQQLLSTYDAGVQSAVGLGLGKDQAIALTRELMGIPPGVSVETWMSDAAELRADTTGAAVGEIPESVFVDTAMSTAAFEVAGMTKQAADDIPNQETIDTWMSDAAFQEALRTRAASLGIPEQEIIDSFMSSAARNEADNTTARVLAIPPGTSISSFMDAYARDMANQTAAAVNSIPSYKETQIVTRYSVIGSPSTIDVDAGGKVGHGQNGITQANGGFLQFNARGTFNNLKQMDKTAQVVPPNTWRVVGDNMTHPEVFAPLDGSQRSFDIMKLGVDHMGYQMVPKGSMGFAVGAMATGGRVDGLRARPGEENWQWQSRQQRIVEQMADVVGQLADWEIQEDGSGWIRTMDNTMIEIADGAWRVSDSAELSARAMGRASEDARWAGETAKAAGESFQGAGFSANATAGTFTVAGQVTQQAAQAIIAATAAVNAAGQQRAAAQDGGVRAAAGEQNAVWRGRQDQFEQAISQQFGGLKYSEIHEDGSGQMELDDGRLIELDNGRWQFVRAFKYGWGPQGPTLSKYAGGGRLPTSGPGTEKQDGFLGVSSMTGQPVAYLDGGEQVTSSRMTDKHSDLLWAIHRDDPRLARIPALAGGGRPTSREYAPAMSYAGPSGGGAATLGQRPIEVKYYSYNAVQEPESQVVERTSSHLSALLEL